MIDADTLRVLEVPRLAERVARLTRTAAGRERAAAPEPAASREEAAELLDETREALGLLAEQRAPALAVDEDGGRLLEAAEHRGSPLLAHELAVFLRWLAQARDLRALLLGDRARAALHAIGRALPDLGALCGELERIVDARGQLLDGASEKLRALRLELAERREQVRLALERLARRPEVRALLRAPHPSIRDGRFVLAVRAESRGQLKGLYHDRSASGATAFVEPEAVVEDQNRLRDLATDEEREVLRILWESTRALLARAAELRAVRLAVARFDLALARATFARDLGLEEPELVDEGPLVASGVRHPLLLAMAFDRAVGEVAERRAAAHAAVVPLDLRLGDSFDLMVVTGPNTGGKTVTLKTAGLLAILPRLGHFLPAAPRPRIPFTRGVFADVGDEQDLSQSLSTFSGHVRRIVRILAAARPADLVLLDELGSGTDPLEGEALAAALLEHLLERQVRAVVTTHLGRLKEFAFRRERAVNASMEFDPDSLRPTYRLVLGVPGASHALRIARNLGLPAGIAADAGRRLEEGGSSHTALYDELERARRALEEMRGAAECDRAAARSLRERASEGAEEVERDRAALAVQAELAAERRLRELAARLEEPRRELLSLGGRHAVLAARLLEILRQSLAGSPLAEMRRRFGRALRAGDQVFLPRFNEVCRVTRLHRKEEKVELDYKNLSVTVGFDEIAPAESAHLFRQASPR